MFEGRLAPQALPRRQMSTGLDGLPSAFELGPAAEEQPAGVAAAASPSRAATPLLPLQLSRAATPLPLLQLSRAAAPVGALERASSLPAALPQQSAA